MRYLISVIIAVFLVLQINAEQRQYLNDIILPTDSLYTMSLGYNKCAFSYEVRAALSKNKERHGLSNEYWTIRWNYISPSDYYYARFRCANSDFGDYADCRYAQIKIGHVSNGVDSVICTNNIYSDVNTATGYNSLMAECRDNTLRIFIGHKRYQLVAELENHKIIDNSQCGVESNVDLKIQSIVLADREDIKTSLYTVWSMASLTENIKKQEDANVGFWTYLDRDNNGQKAKIGGMYRIALVKSDIGYDLIYLSGAVTNSSQWKLGMIKGQLKPTIFKNHYNLVWYDSMFDVIDIECYVNITDNAIMSVHFPLYDTVIRFSKEL